MNRSSLGLLLGKFKVRDDVIQAGQLGNEHIKALTNELDKAEGLRDWSSC